MLVPPVLPGPPAPARRLHLLGLGLLLPWDSLRLSLRLRGVKRMAILPLLVNALCYIVFVAGGLWMLWHWDWNLNGQSWQFWGGFGAWLLRALDQFLDLIKWALGLPLLLAACYFSFTAVGLIVASPFNDLLSERLELALCEAPDRPPIGLGERARRIAGSIFDSLIIVLRQLAMMLLTLPFLLIPIVGLIPLFLVTGYYAGRGFAEIPMSRHDLRRVHKRHLIRANRWQLLGLGLAMEVLFLVPFLGLFILPLGVAAGTVMFCRFDWLAVRDRPGAALPPHFQPPRRRPGSLTDGLRN